MNKGIMLIGTILLTAVSASADNPKKWTLEECINYAMTNNITLKKDTVGKAIGNRRPETIESRITAFV